MVSFLTNQSSCKRHIVIIIHILVSNKATVTQGSTQRYSFLRASISYHYHVVVPGLSLCSVLLNCATFDHHVLLNLCKGTKCDFFILLIKVLEVLTCLVTCQVLPPSCCVTYLTHAHTPTTHSFPCHSPTPPSASQCQSLPEGCLPHLTTRLIIQLMLSHPLLACCLTDLNFTCKAIVTLSC